MRADLYLCINAYAESRSKAQTLIKNGAVIVDGVKISKPSDDIADDIPHDVTITENEKYVGRGGLKLEKALEAFGIDAENNVCVDIGASTGGFTDCLIKHGALRVYAFDAGKGQLHPLLQSDKRVRSKEGFNARFIKPEDVGEPADITVMDVSFISQTLIIPAIKPLLKDDGVFISLIKPQFEAGKTALGKNGIIKSKEDRLSAVEKVIAAAGYSGFYCSGLITSPIKGGDGNEEYLACFKAGNGDTIPGQLVKNIVFGKTNQVSK